MPLNPPQWPLVRDPVPVRPEFMDDDPPHDEILDWILAWIGKQMDEQGVDASRSYASIRARIDELEFRSRRVITGTSTMSFNNSQFSVPHTFMGQNDFGPGGAYHAVIPISAVNGVPSVIFADVGGTANNRTLMAYHIAGVANGPLPIRYIAFVTIPGL